MSEAPLEGVVVIEYAERIAGPLAGLHLSLLGAEVIKAEPTGGDTARSWNYGAVFAVLNAGKRLVSAQPNGRDGRLARLLQRADAAVVDEGPAAALVRGAAGNGRLRAAAVIGNDAVPGGYGTAETLAQAALALTGYVGSPGGLPARIGADLGDATAGVQAVQVILAGLLAPSTTSATVASVSSARALATMKTIHLAGRSDPAAWDGYHVTAGDRPPDRGYRAADGRMSFEFPPSAAAGWREFCVALGLDDLVAEVGGDWYATVGMGERSDWARPLYERGLATVTRAEAVELARRLGAWAVPFLTPAELLRHPQTQLYGALRAVDGGAWLSAPWKFEGSEEISREVVDLPPPGVDDPLVFGDEQGIRP